MPPRPTVDDDVEDLDDLLDEFPTKPPQSTSAKATPAKTAVNETTKDKVPLHRIRSGWRI
ncbi:hypothetical protein QCA50_007478 [Cerrena zonata]|uniref:Uncharacterized protein n=1 Tax=Cerrena zonata TaxID=2478898 RepID=A0AAW0G8C9_9APHY